MSNVKIKQPIAAKTRALKRLKPVFLRLMPFLFSKLMLSTPKVSLFALLKSSFSVVCFFAPNEKKLLKIFDNE